MARGKAHSEDTQAQAKALLLAGEGVMEVARKLNLAESSIRNWKKNLAPDELAQLSAKKGERVEDLVVDYLVTNLHTLRSQSEVVGERTYIEKQPAGELATLHGVIADKSIRLLEALQRASDATGQRQLPV